jgi:hypothetical protein
MARTDTERLDWLTAKGRRLPVGWVVRDSSTGRGFRLHQTEGRESYADPRKAIDAAMDAEGGEPTR